MYGYTSSHQAGFSAGEWCDIISFDVESCIQSTQDIAHLLECLIASLERNPSMDFSVSTRLSSNNPNPAASVVNTHIVQEPLNARCGTLRLVREQAIVCEQWRIEHGLHGHGHARA